MSPAAMVRTMQEMFDSMPEPSDDAEPMEHLRFVYARACRALLSWRGLAVWSAVAIAATVFDVLT